MTGEHLDLCAEVSIPQSNCSILSARQDILCRPLGIACDIDWALVVVEDDMEVARDRSWTTRGRHG